MSLRLVTLSVFLFFCSCSESNEKLLPGSSGNINNISVVASNTLWESSVGDLIRENFSRPIYGLPQAEPVFNLNHIPSKIFSGFATKSRTILKLHIGNKESISNFKNSYASPQIIVQVTAPNKEALSRLILDNISSIYSSLYFSELKEKQRRISKNTNKSPLLKNNLGLSLKFPSAYRIAKEDSNFIWIRRDIESGSVNLSISKVKKGNRGIFSLRDSISKAQIPGPVENTYMSTDFGYKPITQEVNFGNIKTLESRGLWEVENQFMAGPFLNYYIEVGNDEVIILDGFVYSPGTNKREYIFELEAIIRSLKL